MQCQQCGVELEPNSNLCDQCGRSVPEPQTGRISFEGVTNRPTINQNTINVGGMTPHEFSTITGMLAQVLENKGIADGVSPDADPASVSEETREVVKAEEQKVEKALQVFGAVEEKPAHPTWSSWQQLSKFQAEQVANAPGIIEIRVEGATDTIFVESGKSVRDYARRRLIDPERWMSPPEKALLQRGYAMEFRHAVAETKEQARAWKGDYLRQYVEQKKRPPLGNERVPKRANG